MINNENYSGHNIFDKLCVNFVSLEPIVSLSKIFDFKKFIYESGK